MGLLVTAFLLWHPVTRPVIWAALPLGTKPDDLIFVAIAFALVAILVLTARGYVQRNIIYELAVNLFFYKEKRKNDEI